MTKDIQRCSICSQIAGDATGDLISKALGDRFYVRRVPFESASFAVIPSVGPVTPGHSLLCPKSHTTSIARLDEEVAAELLQFKSYLRAVLRRIFEAPVHCFEHGSGSTTRRILCTVEHAHLHFVPAGVDVLDTLLAHGTWIEILDEGLTALQNVVGGDEYLYYENPGRPRLRHASRWN